MGTAAETPRPEITRLGSFEIIRHLARGGMADLYLARTVGPAGFEKIVVLKKILPRHADNPRFVRLFLDEARLAAGLMHPHIAQVYDIGQVDGAYVFTMEYVHGQDLRSTLRRTDKLGRQFPLEHAVGIARDIAGALHYAHERRKPDGALLDIVHRDVSPSNVLVSYDGATKLVDFGVAKAATSSVKTRTGTLKGKIAYMSPEQARGSSIDRRADVFSLGIVLWEMVTTRRLFKSENDLATIQAIINDPIPSPLDQRRECPPELAAIAMKALSRDLSQRYQTAEEMQLDLEKVIRDLQLVSSATTLARHMRELFAAELEAWNEAQANGLTLTQHVSRVDPTTAVSESEVEFASDAEEEIEEDDLDDDGADGLADEKTLAMPPEVAERIAAEAAAEAAERESAERDAQRPPTADVAVPRTVTPASHSEATPFPVAPRDWRQSEPQPQQAAPTTPREIITQFIEKYRNQLFYAGVGLFVLLTLIAIVCSGSSHAPARPPTPP